MPNAIARANARPMPRRRRPVSLPLRRRLEASLENLIALLDELDGDPDLEDGHDAEHDQAEFGIGDQDGLMEQTDGEPSLGATLEIDQRIAWHSGQRSDVIDGEATGTEDDIESFKTAEAHQADRLAARAAATQALAIARRRSAPAHA